MLFGLKNWLLCVESLYDSWALLSLDIFCCSREHFKFSATKVKRNLHTGWQLAVNWFLCGFYLKSLQCRWGGVGEDGACCDCSSRVSLIHQRSYWFCGIGYANFLRRIYIHRRGCWNVGALDIVPMSIYCKLKSLWQSSHGIILWKKQLQLWTLTLSVSQSKQCYKHFTTKFILITASWHFRLNPNCFLTPTASYYSYIYPS